MGLRGLKQISNELTIDQNWLVLFYFPRVTTQEGRENLGDGRIHLLPLRDMGLTAAQVTEPVRSLAQAAGLWWGEAPGPE